VIVLLHKHVAYSVKRFVHLGQTMEPGCRASVQFLPATR
jgi:hypothetical protein